MSRRLSLFTLVALLGLALLPTVSALQAAPLQQGGNPEGTVQGCASAGASWSPAVLNVPGQSRLSASGFQAGSTVTITGGNRPSGGVFDNETTTVTASSSCTITYSLSMRGDSPPGVWSVTVSGTRSGTGAPLSMSASFTVVSTATPTHTPFPTPTWTPFVVVSPTVTCPPPAVSLSSLRITQGQSAVLTARGFRPGVLLDAQIEGPGGFRASSTMGPVSANCEAAISIPVDTSFPAGRYSLTLLGLSATGTFVPPSVFFEVVARVGTTTVPTATELVPGAPTATSTATQTQVTAPAQPSPTATTITEAPVPARPAPVAVEQQLTLTGGARVPTVGETSEYEHVIRINNASALQPGREIRAASLGPSSAGPLLVRSPLFGPLSFNLLAQGETLTLNIGTDYSPDTRVVSTTANRGQAQVRGSTLVWEGQLQAGESLEIRTTLAQTPTTALALNSPIRGQTLTVSDPRGASLIVTAPTPPPLPPAQRLVQPAPLPVDPVTGNRMFAASGFAVADDNIWVYFNRRGGQRTFGMPISRLMLLDGAWVQLFERGMLQVFEDGRVVSVNLLEAPYLPYDTIGNEMVGDVILPVVDEGLIASSPDPAEADLGARTQEFVRANAAEQFEGLATRFYSTFMGAVLFRDAFFDGLGDPNLVPGFNLEIWGLPTSGPTLRAGAAGDVDPGVALQRFQRGLMIHDAGAGSTNAVPLGYSLRAILAGDDSSTALAEVAQVSPLWGQYNPEALDWIDRPDELAETNLVFAFTRDDGEGEAVTIGSRAPALVLLVRGPTVAFSGADQPLWIAQAGETYRVRREQDGWVLVTSDRDARPAGWIPLDNRVELTPR